MIIKDVVSRLEKIARTGTLLRFHLYKYTMSNGNTLYCILDFETLNTTRFMDIKVVNRLFTTGSVECPVEHGIDLSQLHTYQRKEMVEYKYHLDFHFDDYTYIMATNDVEEMRTKINNLLVISELEK